MLNAEKYKERIKELNYRFALCNGEIKPCEDMNCYKCAFYASPRSCMENMNKWLLEECEEPLLTEKEKIIIKDIIKAFEPFGAEVQCIAKYRHGDEPTDYYLNFNYKNHDDELDTFTFNGNELFVGMEVDELYTLEELGL